MPTPRKRKAKVKGTPKVASCLCDAASARPCGPCREQAAGYAPVDRDEFVSHSNRIEGEPDGPGVPLYDDHMAVALMVDDYAASGRAVRPLALHARLMRSEPWKFPGEYRQMAVRVGATVKMDAIDVRPAMRLLLQRAARAVRREPSEDMLWRFHHEFERIHPFIDGNGRVGRLWLNSLRAVSGYPWLVVRYEERETYYRAIEAYEREHDVVV